MSDTVRIHRMERAFLISDFVVVRWSNTKRLGRKASSHFLLCFSLGGQVETILLGKIIQCDRIFRVLHFVINVIVYAS